MTMQLKKEKITFSIISNIYDSTTVAFFFESIYISRFGVYVNGCRFM